MIDYHYFFLIGSVLVAAVSQVLLKKGALHHYDSWIREYLNPWVITGYILMFGSVFLSIMGLRGVDFSTPLSLIRWAMYWFRSAVRLFFMKTDCSQISGNMLHSSGNGCVLPLRSAAAILHNRRSGAHLQCRRQAPPDHPDGRGRHVGLSGRD